MKQIEKSPKDEYAGMTKVLFPKDIRPFCKDVLALERNGVGGLGAGHFPLPQRHQMRHLGASLLTGYAQVPLTCYGRPINNPPTTPPLRLIGPG